MKAHYTEFVGHIARCYFKFPMGTTGADILNWKSVDKIYNDLPDTDKRIIKEYYTTNYTNEWTVIKKFEKRVAKVRGLI